VTWQYSGASVSGFRIFGSFDGFKRSVTWNSSVRYFHRHFFVPFDIISELFCFKSPQIPYSSGISNYSINLPLGTQNQNSEFLLVVPYNTNGDSDKTFNIRFEDRGEYSSPIFFITHYRSNFACFYSDNWIHE
jgi:hypothetical protein